MGAVEDITQLRERRATLERQAAQHEASRDLARSRRDDSAAELRTILQIPEDEDLATAASTKINTLRASITTHTQQLAESLRGLE